MAKPDKAAAESDEKPPSKGGAKGYVLMAVIGLIAGALGFALPQVMNGGAFTKETAHDHDARHEPVSESKHESSANQQAFIPFGEVVVNLAEERLTRYLQVNITILVDGPNEAVVKQVMEKQKTALKNYLIGYLSDKSLDDVRGAAGVNRARREIQDRFNSLLFPDGSEKIRDILFEEFTVR